MFLRQVLLEVPGRILKLQSENVIIENQQKVIEEQRNIIEDYKEQNKVLKDEKDKALKNGNNKEEKR